jgi:hypothetical protein
MDEQCRRVVMGARKAAETGDENAQWHCIHTGKIQAGMLHHRGSFLSAFSG